MWQLADVPLPALSAILGWQWLGLCSCTLLGAYRCCCCLQLASLLVYSVLCLPACVRVARGTPSEITLHRQLRQVLSGHVIRQVLHTIARTSSTTLHTLGWLPTGYLGWVRAFVGSMCSSGNAGASAPISFTQLGISLQVRLRLGYNSPTHKVCRPKSIPAGVHMSASHDGCGRTRV